MRRSALALAALAACATVGDPLPPAPPPSFREVRSLVLVRASHERAGRAKDPLDGLEESLRARGYATRVVEVGAGKEPALERLFLQLESRAGAPRRERFGTLPYGDAGPAAGAVVAALGVDAVVTYHRLEGRRVLPPLTEQPALPGAAFPGPPVVPERGPLGALALVDRSGTVAAFPWGETTSFDDPSVPVNAVEAIDLLLRTLAGEAPDG